MEGEKTGMRKRKDMILTTPLSALCFQHCCRSRNISHFLHVVHLRISLLIYPNPNAMRGGTASSPQPPSSFFFAISDVSHPSIQTLYAKTFFLYVFLSFYSFVYLLYLPLCHLSKRHGGEALRPPPPPPSSFFKHHMFSHASIQPPLFFCVCPSPPQPFVHTHICNYISLLSVHL